MLGQSVKIATLFNIPLKVHWTFAFFFVWIAYIGYQMGMDMAGIATLCGFAIVMFFCVVLHELGHSLTAAHYGVTTKDIIISPIGGVARLSKIPEKPMQELLIAIAGPAVNLVIAVLLFVGLSLFGNQGVGLIGDPDKIFELPSNFLPALFWLNMALIVFNMIPAFPMDGGRVFRALLAMRLDRARATRIAGRVGQLIAISFAFYGFASGDYLLIFIGAFVFISAANESRHVHADQRLVKGKVSDILRGEYTTMLLSDPISHAIEKVREGLEKDFLVFDAWGSLRGVLHEEFIREAEKQAENGQEVRHYLSQHYESVGPNLDLKQLLQIFQRQGYSIIPVYHADQMVGVVDRKGLTQFLNSTPKLWTLKNLRSKFG